MLAGSHPALGESFRVPDRERQLWLEGNGAALEAALNGEPLEESLGILARTAIQLMGGEPRAAFYLSDAERTRLHHVVGMSPEYAAAIEGFEVGEASLACGLASFTGQPILTADVEAEPRWANWLWLARAHGYRGCWSIPVFARGRSFVGTLAIYWAEPRTATAREVELLTQVSQGAALIIARHHEALQRYKAESALRASEERLQTELEDAMLLQSISAALVTPGDGAGLYQRLVDAASQVMRSDFASMQMLFPERGVGGELLLLASRGFSPDAVAQWHWVHTRSSCTCGIALREGGRVIDTDIANSRIMAGTADQAALLENGMRAAQSTPLISRSGRLLGMISTHWRRPHVPAARDLRLLDILARQAADLIERRQAEEQGQKQVERLGLLWESAALALTAEDPDAMLRGLLRKIGPRLGVDMHFNFVVNPAGDALRLASCSGIPEEAARSLGHLQFGEAICGTVAQRREAIVVDQLQESHDPKAALVKSFGARAYACNPLVADGKLLGTLSFGSRTRDRFEADELAFLETISHYVTGAYERLRLLDELRDADRRKDEFLAILAHELRNPLAPIRNAIEILARDGSDETRLRESHAVIERQVEHLTHLVDDLMDISRITRNRLELRTQDLVLSRAIEAAVEASRPMMQKHAHALEVSLPEEPVTLRGDEVRLAQVFMNLLNNAAKYTPPGGRIQLAARRDGSEVVVAVRDSGLGIPAEKLPQLFEIFYQVDRSLEKAQGGLGIGLSLVRRLVEMHGGTVDAQSAGLGHGSEFVVRLPALPAGASPMPAPASRGVTVPAPARRMLIVDDNRDSADTLATLLRMTGHEVHVAYDGQTGVDASARLRPDVILLDLGMPGLNGYEAARRIRDGVDGEHVTLVSLTGWGQEEARNRSLQAGFDAHLVKPVDFSALTSLLATRDNRRRILA